LVQQEAHQSTQQWLNNMTEEQVLERVEKAYRAYEGSTSKWAKNYWLIVINGLKRRYPTS
jgi:hypothetical protein